jgi:hypothetical protein
METPLTKWIDRNVEQQSVRKYILSGRQPDILAFYARARSKLPRGFPDSRKGGYETPRKYPSRQHGVGEKWLYVGRYLAGRVAVRGDRYNDPIVSSLTRGELERTFDALANDWRKETLGLSRVDKKVMHAAYQKIIGMGPQAIPLILRELRDRPSYWFAALRSITRQDPAQFAKTFDEARDAWIAWGREHNYIAR